MAHQLCSLLGTPGAISVGSPVSAIAYCRQSYFLLIMARAKAAIAGTGGISLSRNMARGGGRGGAPYSGRVRHRERREVGPCGPVVGTVGSRKGTGGWISPRGICPLEVGSIGGMAWPPDMSVSVLAPVPRRVLTNSWTWTESKALSWSKTLAVVLPITRPGTRALMPRENKELLASPLA